MKPIQEGLFHSDQRLNSASQYRSTSALTLLTNVSITSVYREPAYRSETVTQSYLGEKLQVLKTEGDWLRIKLEDGYEGWIPRSAVVEIPPAWEGLQQFYPADQIAWIHSAADKQSTTVRDVTILSGLPLLGRQDGWVQVLLPDGTAGWLEDRPRVPLTRLDVEELIETAMRFMGIQYLWGGRSPKGFDCSGFVQTCFKLNGLQLPRDAYQQAEVGIRVGEDFHNWQPGDLIFFSERPEKITHVAISLGDGDFIHASGFVKINSLNPENGELYTPHYSKIFTQTMRVA